MQMTQENSIEDYWEDSSVTWGCRGLSFSSCIHQTKQEAHTVDNNPQDFHIAASSLRHRNFPPPITVCNTLSTIKSGGRFVLKEMASLPLHALRAEREQGRLCLHLIEPQHLDEEEEEEGNDDDTCDKFCNLQDTLECADPHRQEPQDGYEALDTEDINLSIISHEKAKHGTIQGIPQELVRIGEAPSDGMPEKHAHTDEALRKECTDKNKDVASSSSTSEKHAMKHIETRNNGIGACRPSIVYADVESKECTRKHSNGGGTMGIGQHQRASLWSKEASNGNAPFLSKEVLSFARASPALGLAVS